MSPSKSAKHTSSFDQFEQDSQDSLSQQVAQANLAGFDGPSSEPKCTSAIQNLLGQ